MWDLLQRVARIAAGALFGGIVGLTIFVLPGSIVLVVCWMLSEPLFQLMPEDLRWRVGLLAAGALAGAIASAPFATAGFDRVGWGALAGLALAAAPVVIGQGSAFGEGADWVLFSPVLVGAGQGSFSASRAASMEEVLTFEPPEARVRPDRGGV